MRAATAAGWQERAAEAERMWFGDDSDLTDDERQAVESAKATIERVRTVQRLRAEVKRTDEAHRKALAALAEAVVAAAD